MNPLKYFERWDNKGERKYLLNNKFAQVGLAVLVALILGLVLLMSYSKPESEKEQPGTVTKTPVASKSPLFKMMLEKNISVEDSANYKSRDLFESLQGSTSTVSQSQSTSTSSSSQSTSSASDSTEGKTNSTNNPNSLPWLRLESKSDTNAVIRYDSSGSGSNVQTYEVSSGERFATNFLLASISGDYVVVWNGDERIELKLGEVKYL